MEYERITQCSRLYRYGENEEFKTKEEAEDAIKKLENQTKTELAIKKLYDVSEVDIYEAKNANAFILMVTIKIPNLFEEK